MGVKNATFPTAGNHGIAVAAAPAKNITEQVGTLGALLRLPYERLVHYQYGELAGRGFSDIRPAHSAVFRHILPQGSRVTDLAERAQITKQSMAYLVEYLQERGYATIVPDPRDGRAKLVCLTERGLALQETLLSIGRRTEAELAQVLGVREMSRLRALLERLPQALEQCETARAEAGSVKNGK